MATLALCLTLVAAPEEGFEPLFNGLDMDGWRLHLEGDGDPFRVVDGAVVCSGSPAGYMATEASYRDYTLRFEWRYARPEGLTDDLQFGGNSGYLIHITQEDILGVWPRSIEVQGMNRDAGRILPIPRSLSCEFEEFEEDRRAAIRPLGEWNDMEIESCNGSLVVSINGVVVSRVIEGELFEGPIGFQSEGAEIHWRNIRIRRDP